MAASTPVSAWVAAIMPGTAVGQSSNLTATVQITAGWEIQLPVAVRFSNVSADPMVFVYPTMDGGATYDTVPMTSFLITRIAQGTAQASIRLSTGQYAIQLQSSGANTMTFMIPTQLVITAINQ